MPLHKSPAKASIAGRSIGILCMDEYLPFAPGDVNNASSYPFPVWHRLVPGWHSADMLTGGNSILPVLIDAARDMEAQGVQAILTNCGYTLPYQQQLAAAVRIPVASSPLVLLPLVASTLPPEVPIGVLGAAAPPLTEDFIRGNGITIDNPLAVYGLQDEPGINEMLKAVGVGDDNGAARASLMTLDTDLIAADMVRVASRMLEDHPSTGAIVFECSDFPPYARAVQQATGLPVFDSITLAEMLFATIFPPCYSGAS